MKRRWLAIVCAAAMLLLAATSCEPSGNEPEEETPPALRLVTKSFYNAKYGTDYQPYMMMYGNTVVCTDETAQAYPSLAKALDEDSNQLLKTYEELADTYTPDMLEENPYLFSDPHRYTYESMVRRTDQKAVSVISFTYAYAGGVHANYGYGAQNYDTATGELIRLSDIVKDEEKLREALVKALYEDYPNVDWFEEELTLDSYRIDWKEGDEEGNPYLFSLDPDGVCFYFNPYELAPFAGGMQTVKLLYSAEPALFADGYAAEGSYAAGVYREGKFDLGGDGTVDSVYIESINEDGLTEDYYTQVYVAKNGNSITADLYGFRLDTYLMHTADNRDYLYVFSHQDNDGTELMIFDMNGEKPSVLKATGYGLPVSSEEDYGGYWQITDSSDFALTFRCDLLATFSASFATSVGADGTPVLPEDGFYQVPETIEPLQSKADFRADIVDGSGKVVQKDVLLKAGESFKLLRTDGRTVIDATLSDGRIARIHLVRDEDTYTGTVNGQLTENEAFETLYYAG